MSEIEELEEKTEKLTKLLDEITKEFEELQSLVSGDNSALGCFLPNTRINMDGSKEEDECLVTGWHPSEKGFRWGGKGREHPTIYFRVSPNRSYRLNMNIFVPKAITKSPIKLFANDVEIESFVSEGQIKKTIYIPSNLVKSDKLKILFESDFWDPSKLNKTLDSRILSLAFNYMELTEV